MTYLSAHWGYPWVAVAAIVATLLHERGLRALNARSTRAHAQARRRKMWLSYAGIALATLSVISPLQYWSMEYFWVHMIQHVTVMLAAPALYVAGAPAIPLLHAVPVRARRRLLRRIFVRPTRHPLRRIGAVVLSPIVAVVLFNVVMVVWMIPRVFNPCLLYTSPRAARWSSRVLPLGAGDAQVQHRHAHGHAICHLSVDHAGGKVGRS